MLRTPWPFVPFPPCPVKSLLPNFLGNLLFSCSCRLCLSPPARSFPLSLSLLAPPSLFSFLPFFPSSPVFRRLRKPSHTPPNKSPIVFGQAIRLTLFARFFSSLLSFDFLSPSFWFVSFSSSLRFRFHFLHLGLFRSLSRLHDPRHFLPSSRSVLVCFSFLNLTTSIPPRRSTTTLAYASRLFAAQKASTTSKRNHSVDQ